MLTKDSAVIAETGDAWFNCQKLKLPDGCSYEFQMQYGSIGWAVGATFGYAQGAKQRRVIACIGDGSFQVQTFLSCRFSTAFLRFMCGAHRMMHFGNMCHMNQFFWKSFAYRLSKCLQCNNNNQQGRTIDFM